MSNVIKVIKFREKFDLPIGKLGQIITDKRALLRTRLMTEELAELIEAMQLKDYVNIAHELADVLYVTYETAIEYGVPIDKVFAEVHKANMTKTKNKDGGGKVKKGPDFNPANLKKVLK